MIRDLASSLQNGGADVFVHVSSLQQGASLREVSFELGQDRKTVKFKAENVSVL